jgi:hypothetical protein
MRDVKRIPKILRKLKEIWEKNPEMRLGQLIENAFLYLGKDIYYVEDEDLIKRLEEFYSLLEKNSKANKKSFSALRKSKCSKY